MNTSAEQRVEDERVEEVAQEARRASARKNGNELQRMVGTLGARPAAGDRAAGRQRHGRGSVSRDARILARRPVRAAKPPATNGQPAAPTVAGVRERHARELFARLGRIYGPSDPGLARPPERHARRALRPPAAERRRPRGPRRLRRAAALTPLYQRHRGPVYRFALLWSGSAAVAADVTQDVFVHLLTHADDYDAGARPALAVAPRHRPQLRPPARGRRTPATCADDDDVELAEAPEPRRHARDALDCAARRSSACARPSPPCRRTTATCSCWWSSPSARTPKPRPSAAASSTPCARGSFARARLLARCARASTGPRRSTARG